MIRIHSGQVKNSAMITNIEIDGVNHNVVVAVDNDYRKFLSPERADYALVGMLAYALRNGHDIVCETPVTDELLYRVKENLIPTLLYNDSRNYPVKIRASMASALDKYQQGGGVGTGLSCGVDSFHAVMKHLNSEYTNQNLTHITVYNIGSINNCYGEENIARVKSKVFERTEKVTEKIGLPLVKLESNFQDVIPQDHYRSHTYMDALAIYSLQKLWRVYYYADTYSNGEFSLAGNFDVDPAHFELFLLDCISTSKLKILSEGGEGDRNDKIKFIADSPVACENLHVCTAKEFNCGVCEKCLRTLLAIDALNKLDNFKAVFDIDAYNKNRVNAYLHLYQQHVLLHNPLYSKTYEILYKRYKSFFDSIVITKGGT